MLFLRHKMKNIVVYNFENIISKKTALELFYYNRKLTMPHCSIFLCHDILYFSFSKVVMGWL